MRLRPEHEIGGAVAGGRGRAARQRTFAPKKRISFVDFTAGGPLAQVPGATYSRSGVMAIEDYRGHIKQIAANCGLDGSVIAHNVENNNANNYGFNALTQEYGDLIDMGVIVPTKVERIALQNAASIAGLLLTTDAAVVEIKEKKAAPAGAGMDDMDY